MKLHLSIKKILAWVPMYVCYYTGELAYQILDLFPDDWDDETSITGKIASPIYNVYNRCMWWSSEFSAWAHLKFWHRPCEDCGGTGSTPISTCLKCGGEGKLYD